MDFFAATAADIERVDDPFRLIGNSGPADVDVEIGQDLGYLIQESGSFRAENFNNTMLSRSRIVEHYFCLGPVGPRGAVEQRQFPVQSVIQTEPVGKRQVQIMLYRCPVFVGIIFIDHGRDYHLIDNGPIQPGENLRRQHLHVMQGKDSTYFRQQARLIMGNDHKGPMPFSLCRLEQHLFLPQPVPKLEMVDNHLRSKTQQIICGQYRKIECVVLAQ